MPDQHTADDDGGPIGPITDHESLRDREDVPFHEVTDVVDAETVAEVAALDDMAPVGVENDDGEVLVMQVTADCAWKIPSAAVEPGGDYAATARRWVAEQAGLDVELDGIAGVWHFRLRSEAGVEDGEEGETGRECDSGSESEAGRESEEGPEHGSEEATRTFVVFSATPSGEPPAPDSDAGSIGDGRARDVEWVDALPADAEAVPGTDLFVE